MARRITLPAIPPRRPDWYEALSRYLAETARTPFVHGEMDCALFAAGAVAAMTGVDPAARWRGRYRTLKGGLGALRRAGFADHEDLTATLLPEIPVALAQPGDLAVVDTATGPALGVVALPTVLFRTPTGLGSLPFLQATRGFRVI